MTDANDNVLAEFRRVEHAGWERLAHGYDVYFMSLAAQMIEPMLDAAAVAAGSRVLDLCCGPGYVAGRALARGALPVGLDYSRRMLAIAQRNYPQIPFREGDAENLDFPDRAFDAVLMNLGLHHIARPERALAEASRVLRPGGRLAFTVWAAPAASTAHRIIFDAVKAHGRLDVVPDGPSMFRFSASEECRKACEDAGLHEVTVDTLDLVWDLPAPDGLIEASQAGAVRLAMVLGAQAPESLSRIREAIRTASGRYKRDARVCVPIAVVLTSAVRPVQ
jgi:ubiquinone/menaquinone biosynthesis C-methylase UbiE